MNLEKKHMDEAMNLYSPDGASTRGSACRNCPTEQEYIEFFHQRLDEARTNETKT